MPEHTDSGRRLPNEFAPTPLPDDATEAEIDERDLRDAAREQAILPWRIAHINAMDRRLHVTRHVAKCADDVRRLEAELATARERLAVATSDAADAMPALDESVRRAKSHYEAARAAVLSAGDPGSQWRYSRSGRIVSVDGALDLSRTDYVVQIALGRSRGTGRSD